jgi:ATP-dependent protease ClpP protease subunit
MSALEAKAYGIVDHVVESTRDVQKIGVPGVVSSAA